MNQYDRDTTCAADAEEHAEIPIDPSSASSALCGAVPESAITGYSLVLTKGQVETARQAERRVGRRRHDTGDTVISEPRGPAEDKRVTRL